VEKWVQWWSGDVLGVLLIAPLVISWNSESHNRPARTGRALEAILLLAITVALSYVVFQDHCISPGRKFFLLPIIVWAALRLGVPGVSLISTVAAVVGVAAAIRYETLFCPNPTHLAVQPVLMQSFFTIATASSLLMAVVYSELQESRVVYHDLVETAQDLIWQCDEQGHFTYLNPAWESVMGYTVAEMLGKRFTDFQRPEQAERDMTQFVRLLSGETLSGYETIHLAKDGREVQLVFNAKFLRHPDGHIAGTRGTAYDITARKRAEAAANESLSLLRQSQRIAGLGHYILDLPTGNWTGSEMMDEVFGLTSTDPHTLAAWEEMLHPDDRDAMIAYFRDTVVGQGQRFDREYRIVRRRDGVVRWLHGIGDLVFDDAHRPLRMFGTIQDITDRKRTEASAHEAHLLREALFHGARDAILIADPATGRIVQANRQAEALLGRPIAEIVGMHQSELHPADLREQLSEAFRQQASGKDSNVETELLHQSGERIPVEISSSLVTTPDGKVLLQGIFRDVRERLRLEERLRQSEKLTAIGQLAGGIAHDFNNQLAGILGYADMLADELTEATHKRHAQSIVLSAQRAADLTQQLLAFSRKGKYLTMPVDAHRLIGEVVSVLERSIDKRIHIVQDLKAGHPIVMGDPTQLQNALLNVALNARDAMAGSGELTFATEVIQLDEALCQNSPHEIIPGPYLRISVTDTGCGMSDDVKKHLFEPFFTTKKLGEGTGMGLASVYGAVRNHHGSINIYSEVGRGTTIRICLPLGSGSVQPDEPDARAALTHGSARILVVDDETSVREMAATILRHLGYSVTTCADGREATEYYAAHWQQLDLVILDMVMPVMGGRDAFLAMRRINPQLRAILSSGYSLNGEAQAILDEGVLSFIGKPFRRAELAGRVAEALVSCGK
jgi:PAS domain S-box-containing protein